RAPGECGSGDPGGLVRPPRDVRGRLAALERARCRGAGCDRRRSDGAPRAAGRATRRPQRLLDAPHAQGRPLPHALAPRPGRPEPRGGHGKIGRRDAGHVTQVLAGSVGLDDWEWGVTLFAGAPLVFKKLVHEMRFGPASSRYALFGAFYVGIRFIAGALGEIL